jgi:hypothetical protein
VKPLDAGKRVCPHVQDPGEAGDGDRGISLTTPVPDLDERDGKGEANGAEYQAVQHGSVPGARRATKDIAEIGHERRRQVNRKGVGSRFVENFRAFLPFEP